MAKAAHQERTGLSDMGTRIRDRLTDWGLRRSTLHALDSQRASAPAEGLAAFGRLVGDTVGDSALVLGQKGLRARPFGQQDIARKEREVDEALDLAERRGWMDEPMSFHARPQPAAVRVTKHSFGIGAFEQLSFNSDFAPDAEDPGRNRWLDMKANQTAHAWGIRNPQDASRWMLCVPGLAMGQPFFDLAAFDAVRRQRELGINVLVYVPPLHGPRKSGWMSGGALFDSEPLYPLHFMAQAVWDLRRLLGWIEIQGGVAVGAYGLGLGASAVSLLSNLEPKLACAIAGMPVVDFIPDMEPYCSAVERESGEDRRRVQHRLGELYAPISPFAGQCALPPHRRYVYAGKRDRIAPIAQARRLHAHWDHPEAVWLEGSHTTHASEVDAQVMVDGALIENGVARLPTRGRGRSDRS